MEAKFAVSTRLTALQLCIPCLFSLPHDSHASCEAGSQLCFLSQSSFMWSLPHVLPVPLCSVDSENGGGAPCGGLRQNREKSFLLSLAT